jgi:chromate reductase
MNQPLHILGIAGSIRKGSLNAGLLAAAQEMLPAGMDMEIADISAIPLYNQDVAAGGTPEAVKNFKDQIRSADGLLIATPEYNYSVPGVLKNALDWASRPAQEQVFSGKPLAIMGAGGRMGTSRAQYHLRQIAVYLNMYPLNRPEVMIQQAREKFDSEGCLVDEAARQEIKNLLVAFKDWIETLKS